MKIRTAITSTLAVAFTHCSFAQAPPDTARTYQLDPIVVTATQLEALRSTVPNAVSVLTKADITTSGETSLLSLISKRVPGVFVTERGVLGYGTSDGSAGGITIRGAGGSPNTEVLVLTDGRPQMMGLFGHPLPDTYVASGVERIEVIRGPASLMYGTNAMGGVINFISDKGTGVAAHAGAAYGSFNTEKFEVGTGYASDVGSFTVSGDHYETGGHRPYSDFRINNGSFRGEVPLSQEFTLNGDLSVSRFKTYNPGPASQPLIDNWFDITRGSAGISVEDHFKDIHGALKTFINFGVHDISDGFHSTDDNAGFMLYQGFAPFAGNEVTVGIDEKRYGGKADNHITLYDFGSFFVNEMGGYVLTQQRLFERLTASAGVRYNKHSLYGGVAVPQFGLAYAVTGETTVKASASRGFRSPTIRELYLFPSPTPTLQPERQWSYDVSLLQSIGRIASFELTGFLAEGDHLIRAIGAYPNIVLNNSGRFTHRGVEFSGSADPWADFSINLTYSFLDPERETAANPKHKMYAGGTFRRSGVTASLGVEYIAGLYGDDNGNERLPEYAVVDARVTYALTDLLSVYLSAENLLDRKYQILYDYPMPGRTLLGGVSWTAL